MSGVEEVERGYAMGALVTGVITGVCGLASMICGFLWIAHGGGGAHGVWSGLILLVIGILGIVIFVKRNKCAAIAFLVLNIFAIILAGVQAALAGILALLFAIWIEYLDTSGCSSIGGKCVCSGSTALNYDLTDCDELIVMRNSLTAIVAFCAIGCISTFAGSIVGCCIACCQKPTVVQPVVLVNQPPQQVIITSTGQQQQQQGYPPQDGTAPPPAY